MKKIGIITIISRNYGNRLQNYALQEGLKKIGVTSQTIPMSDNSPSPNICKIIIKSILHLFTKRYPNIAWEWFDYNIKWDRRAIKGHKQELIDSYDYFVAWSDQIWNPLFKFNSDRELLLFAPKEKRVAYAASIGISKFPSDYIEHYGKAWSEFAAISVREEDAADIIYNTTGIRPQVVIDPTLLLNKEDWLKVIKKAKGNNSHNYCFKYFLGPISKEYDDYIQKFANSNGYQIIDILGENREINGKIGPAEFLKLLYYSEVVFTDSFHGSLFSILFERPFIVFERPFQSGYGTMSSRLDTLLKTFRMENRRVTSLLDLQTIKQDCDYSEIQAMLDIKQKEARAYLKSALEE